eukprot:Colp12_sorted_trinity150504_noHs@1913
MGKVVLANAVAESFRAEIKAAIEQKNLQPLLVGFLANSDPAAKKYAEWTAKTCAETGVKFELREVNRNDLEEKIIEANEDEVVHGIIVYYPVFGHTQDQYIQNCVNPLKDVEGLCHTFRYNLYHNKRFLDKDQTQKCILPCTPLAMVKILEYIHVYNRIIEEGNRLHGRTITIVNRSEVVGRPLAALLSNDGARVYSVDVTGVQLFHRGPGIKLGRHEVEDTQLTAEEAVRQSDVVITGVPTQGYKLPSAWVRDGAVCINFSTFKNFEDDIKEKASIYVPSVGKVTVCMLERNLVRLCQYQADNKAKAAK